MDLKQSFEVVENIYSSGLMYFINAKKLNEYIDQHNLSRAEFQFFVYTRNSYSYNSGIELCKIWGCTKSDRYTITKLLHNLSTKEGSMVRELKGKVENFRRSQLFLDLKNLRNEMLAHTGSEEDSILQMKRVTIEHLQKTIHTTESIIDVLSQYFNIDISDKTNQDFVTPFLEDTARISRL